MKAVILAAGFGSRLWPLSTSDEPKQFQTLIQGRSLLQYTYALLGQSSNISELYVLTLEALKSRLFEQLPDIAADHVVLVPERRNTLPHILYALNLIAPGANEPILFAGVDHVTKDAEIFISSLDAALGEIANNDAITLLCEKTERLDPTLGYIQLDGSKVKRFIEKPSEKEIASLLEAGPCYKNFFLFVASKQTIGVALDSVEDVSLKDKAKRLLNAPANQLTAQFLEMPVVDISSAVFQRSNNLRAHPGKFGLIDVGRYITLHEINSVDQQGNAILGNVLLEGDCGGNFLVNQLGQPLVVIDVCDSVVVQTPAGTLVSPIASADKVGELYKAKIHQRHIKLKRNSR